MVFRHSRLSLTNSYLACVPDPTSKKEGRSGTQANSYLANRESPLGSAMTGWLDDFLCMTYKKTIWKVR